MCNFFQKLAEQFRFLLRFQWRVNKGSSSWPGFVPAIHVFATQQDVDARIRGHDGDALKLKVAT